MPVKYVKWLVGPYISNEPAVHALHPSASYSARPVTRIIVLEHGPNPSTDYYIRPRLRKNSIPYEIINCSSQRPDHLEIPGGTFIIIVRYLTRSWGTYLLRHRHLFSGVALFMDDDLIAAKHSAHLPLHYRHKIHSLFERQLDQLNLLCSQLWLSTANLAEVYAHCAPRVLPPLPLCQDVTETPLTYFYHGSAAHQAEITWLLDVVAEVQRRCCQLNFLIIGGGDVNRLFRSLPRTMVIHPLSWHSYGTCLATVPHHIGLVPLLPCNFNNGRSHTKFFDLTRFGSVGIYSDTPPYSQFIRNNVDGILLENSPELWIKTIISLAEDRERRMLLLAEARKRINLLMESLPEPLEFCS